ncbi:hypothetical protein OU995_04415 [Roseateles sp. SL47]|jgi:hypothetical protein|uniref:hypothetical protein n=1 Tax=Roseateles sp. SL47 TaxID=2995138 RepID=UPI0022709485|nr:hypothetical protein [Roseateles sp. SL47]WAC73983.1 hypothetical protein OU995_04415 [Roseateles sp. SL47]
MSPLIHRSLTWTIVGTVVSMSTWLAGSVQIAHERQGPRFGAPSASPVTLKPALPAPRAVVVSTAPEPTAQVVLPSRR